MKKVLGAIVGVLIGLALLACGTGSKVGSPTPNRTGTAAAAAAAAASPTPAVAKIAKFGESFSWDDKLSVSVVSVQKYKASSTAAGYNPGETGVKVKVTVTNGSAAAFDLALFDVKLSSGQDGLQAADIFDTENGLNGGFEGTVQPGRAATAVYAFSVPPANLTVISVEIRPGFEYQPATFEGAAS